MPDFSRVLCAVDLTEPSRRALDCGLWWARQHGADVSVLHVRHLPPPADSAGMGGDVASAPTPVSVPPPQLTPVERGERMLELEAFVHARRTDGLQVEVLLDEDATLAGAILARADALAADLIVIGAGTHATDEHPALGRVTTEVWKDAQCSVLVVPPPAPDVANPCLGGVHRIMCAVSLSDASVPALECATSLAGQAAAHLTVVHVVELFSEVAALAYDFDAHREARLQPACDDLVALVAMVVGDHAPVEEIVAQGTASRELLKLADEVPTDLIVLGRGPGARARTGTRHTGPVVAREARCPVLFVHAEVPVLHLEQDPLLAADPPAAPADEGLRAQAPRRR
jgi:nucleotide-binding universal stress UspA family protein